MSFASIGAAIAAFWHGTAHPIVAEVETAAEADIQAWMDRLKPVAVHLAAQAQTEGANIIESLAPQVLTNGLRATVEEAVKQLTAAGKNVSTEAIASALTALSHAQQHPAAPQSAAE